MALDNAHHWSHILAVIVWFREHPNSNLYLRQLDIAGVDTKFIEARKALISELLDIAHERGVQSTSTSARNFEERYGLRGKPPTIRFRLLDRTLAIGGLLDVATPLSQFASLVTPVEHIFITENEINGLAFPDVAKAMVVFGLGYRLDLLSSVAWMRDKNVYYWGDIDTHGFAMLNRLRTLFPKVQSLLMDNETLLVHKPLWVEEETPFGGSLPHLKPNEQQVYQALLMNTYGERVRLEQERIAYGHLQAALQKLGNPM